MHLATAGATAVTAAAPAAAGYARSHAIVIGVGDYDTLPDLPGAERDARAVTAVLMRRGFDVQMLLSADARRQNLMRLLGDELPNRLGDEDRLIIYFAGHGVSTGRAGEAIGYLMPRDANRSSPRATGIAMTELVQWFGDYRAKHVLFVADACYSGLSLSSRSIGMAPNVPNYLTQVISRRVRFALVAGARDQEAHEWQNRGVMTHFLIEAMEGGGDANGDGAVTSTELFAFVQPRVSQLVSEQFNAVQTPQMGRMGEGEFVFYAAGAEGTAANADMNAAATCPAGQEASRETEGHCCWPGQVWGVGAGEDSSAARCRGLPTCFEGWVVEEGAEACRPARCVRGKVRANDGVTCCWPGQVAARGTCRGVPECPDDFERAGEDCLIERGFLEVTMPAGRARVYVNEELVGRTPLRRYSVPVGEHTIELWTEDEGIIMTQTVQVRANETTQVEHDL